MSITGEQAAKLLEGTTPGPWRVQTRYSWVSQGESQQVVWDVPQSLGLSLVADTGGTTLSKHKDARLIAAAPDLARALIASEAARKLAVERLAKAVALLNGWRMAAAGYQSVESMVHKHDSTIKEIGNG